MKLSPKEIELMLADIKCNKIREGTLFKRSKYLKEWRPRHLVLTCRYLYIFSDDSLTQVHEIIELKNLKYYKSFLLKEEKMMPAAFELRINLESIFLAGKNSNEKWSWLVTIQRLMDFNLVGQSFYNKFDWVVAKGFDSQLDFQNGGRLTPASFQIAAYKSSKLIEEEAEEQADRFRDRFKTSQSKATTISQIRLRKQYLDEPILAVKVQPSITAANQKLYTVEPIEQKQQGEIQQNDSPGGGRQHTFGQNILYSQGSTALQSDPSD